MAVNSALRSRYARELLQDARSSPLSFLYCTRTIAGNFSTSARKFAHEEDSAVPDTAPPLEYKRSHGTALAELSAQRKESQRRREAREESARERRSKQTDEYERGEDGPARVFRLRGVAEGQSRAWDDSFEGNDHTNRDHGIGYSKPSFHADYRNESKSRSRTAYVPFEDGTEGADFDPEDSTITPSERKAFDRLFELQQSTPPERNSPPKVTTPREYDVGAMLQEASQSNPEAIQAQSPSFPEALRPMAEKARLLQTKKEKKNEEQREPRRRSTYEIRKKREVRTRDMELALARTTEQMTSAKTDAELWRRLQKNVLKGLEGLGQASSPQDYKQSRSSYQGFQLGLDAFDVLAHNLPHYLNVFNQTCRDKFPSSDLTLAILPKLRKLGPTSFALGISTSLYNNHMYELWERYRDLNGINETLADMDKNVVDFDDETFELCGRILKHSAKVRHESRERGEVLYAIYQSDTTKKKLHGIRKWVGIMRERLQIRALREMRSEEEMEKYYVEEW